MAKLVLGINKSDTAIMEKLAAENTFSSYTGEPPTPGVYEGVIKTIWYTLSKKTEKPMLKIAFEIREPAESPKAKFNGWFRVHNQILPVDKEDEQYGRNCGDLKQFLEAIAQGPSAWKGYLNDSIDVDDSKPNPKINAFGTYKHNAKTGAPVVVIIKQNGEYNDAPNMEITQFNLPRPHQVDASLAATAKPAAKKLVVDDEPEEDTGIEVEEEEQEEAPKPARRKAPARRKPEPEPEPEADDEEDAVDEDDIEAAYVADDEEEDTYVPDDTAEEAEEEAEAEEEEPAEPVKPVRRRRRATFGE
jgi:hypothetical protein